MITVAGVTRKYGSFTAVDDVSFTAEAGRVTGFLGPNGAGKSTTMRIMVGLTRATAGTVAMSGRQYVDLPNPGLEVGVLLDASAQHAGRTGRQILTIAQQYMGLPRSRVEEISTRPVSDGCAIFFAATPTAAAPSCCPLTCSTRSRSSPMTS